MNDPIKIIHKYKNNNGRIQYHIHVFLEDIVSEKCMKVLKKIKEVDLYTGLTMLTEPEREILVKNYGEFWYEKFFNSYHINSTKDNLLQNPAKMKELKSIYDSKWILRHITNYAKRLQTVTYRYEYTVREERERKMIKKIIQKQQQDADEIVDYTTIGRSNNLDIINTAISSVLDPEPVLPSEETADEFELKEIASDRIRGNKSWCSDSSSEVDEDDIDEGQPDFTDSSSEIDQIGGDEELGTASDFEEAPVEFDFENTEEDNQIAEFETEVENDMENLDVLFSDIDQTDKNIKLTTKEIKAAISNETYEKLARIADFDTSKDNSMFDENLKDVYSKNYIIHQYIYKDDTIKTIHNKICCGFKNNPKFGDNSYIIPSYQYLWSEYYYDNKMEKVMVGQKWIIKNNLLRLDVEPNNNLGVYEDLRSGLKVLRDNIRRQGKIKREDDENNILYDYDGFYTCNELYLIDIYNEFGTDYDPNFEEQKNLIDVYLRIYFPYIRPEEMANILDFLNHNTSAQKKSSELTKLKMIFDSINNDLILENEIMRDIEVVKKKNVKDYTKIFQENFVTQSVIRAYLLDRYKKIDLFRIFDNFMLDAEYPFIQYQPTDGTPRYRYSEKYLIENERKEIIIKWFENAPYGISFKVRVGDDQSDYKYMAINLSENGRIDYKIQWKEEDMSTVDDISKTYQYIRKLVEKINKENEKFHIRLIVPTDDQFRFAFINTIQRFELPNNFMINHNDLSEFSRYFFPYVALVIEPRKRQSKVSKADKNEKSKFGTYLRYKRVSKYENRTKIEHRIIFFMRNYEYDDQSLANEIGKEFNITEEQAFGEIQSVREKYPNLKKTRKVLKKLENIPKYKPPGIGVDIQGKQRNKYKMRIAGARDREQLDRIINFMNVLIYLYTETYLYKKPDRQRMKDRLKRLTKIARRRNKVDEIVNHESTIKTVKQMTSIDKKRLGYKAEEDQNQWTRDCQNSGDDKKRRPQQFLAVEELQKLGYVWKEDMDGINFGHYERKIMVDVDGKTDSSKKKHEVILRAIKLPLDDTGENFVYYTCGPEENGKHMYIGFLNKSRNPYGESMPCCFIKDHLYSKNKEKRNFYLKSIGVTQDSEDANKILGDQLYILQDSNKIQEGRFAFLPKYLDIFLNFILGNTRNIKNHYLISTPTGYYFKYGARQDEYKYLNAICSVLDTTVAEIKSKLIAILDADRKTQSIFTSLNNGDIRTQFGTIDAYLGYIKNNEYLEYPFLNDLLCLPGVINPAGINIIIFQKKIRLIKETLEKEKIKESYYIVCQNPENVNDITDPSRDTIFIIKESKNYYPIIMVNKESEETRDVQIVKKFRYDTGSKNIINHILKYYKINCQSEYQVLINDNANGIHNAKETVKILYKTGEKDYKPKIQIVDARFKCKFIVTNAKYIIPVMPSGTLYDLPITNNVDKYLQDYNTTVKYLIDVDKKTSNQLKIKPIGIFYKEKKEKSYLVSAVMTDSYDSVPVIERLITMDYIKREGLIVQNKPADDMIDKEILKGPGNSVVDTRIYEVSKNKYETEMYQLYRYHLSFYINNVASGKKYKEKLLAIINSTKKDKYNKKIEIKKLLYQMSDTGLARTFNELVKTIQKGGLDPLADAKTPDFIVEQPVPTVQIIPKDFNVRDRQRGISNLREEALTPESNNEFDLSEPVIPSNAPVLFTKNDPPTATQIVFPPDEKTWIRSYGPHKKIDYPNFILKNNRELCYNNHSKDTCNLNQHCNWSNSKSICLLSVRQDLLVDFINMVAEEFVQNELKGHEILMQGDYFVSDIVNYNIFTERPGERIIMSSNTNLNKILSEIFGRENIPRIGKRRSKIESLQNYDQLNLENPLKDLNNWYVQNIIDNNNSVFRGFANGYYWLMHPYNEKVSRNLGYYSSSQTNLSNIYKSQVIDWLTTHLSDKDSDQIMPYIKNGNIVDFAIKLSTDVHTLTNCLVELYAMSKINETIIYIYDTNYNIIFVFHPKSGLVYNHTIAKTGFDGSKYHTFKKNVNLRFHYQSKSTVPHKIEVMYPKI